MPTALFKPTGDHCNLACRHCFYNPPISRNASLMSRDTLDAATRFLLAEGDAPVIFAWQGGEPTLAGLEFYQEALAHQRPYSRSGRHIGNSFQTNGLLLDERWARFFAQHNFLVGLSIDGPADCHDALRLNANGAGSHSLTIQAWRTLQRFNCPTNILCVVHQANYDRPLDVYHFLTRELGADYLQFIPCVEWGDDGQICDFSLQPGQYGRFLVSLFDLWAAETQRSISVRLFDDLVLFLAGKPMRDCSHRSTCDAHIVIEADGSIYPCDFFVQPDLLLGNVHTDTLTDIRSHNITQAFHSHKANHLPTSCASCPHLDICQSGCRKFWRSNPQGGALQYLCSDFRYFLDHRRAVLQNMADAVRARW